MTTPGRTEPRGLTISDLIWLTVGVAVATSLGWYHADVAGGRIPRDWYLSAEFLVETLMKGCLAITPVLLARRVRQGGAFGAIEFGAIEVGFSHLIVRLEQLPWLGLIRAFPNAPRSLSFNGEAYDAWQFRFGVASGLALAVAIFRRHRRPAWATGLLLVVAWCGITGPLFGFYQHWWNDRYLVQGADRGWPRVAFLLLNWGPMQVAWFVTLAAAMVEAVRRPTSLWTWFDRAALAFPLLLASIAYGHNFVKNYAGGPAAEGWLYAGMLFGPLAIATVLVRALTPAWNRFFAIDERIVPELDPGSPDPVSGPGG